MNSQYRVGEHIDLHHKDFKKLCVANFLFAMSSYIMLPVLMLWTEDLNIDRCQRAAAMLAFGIGTFVLGGFGSYLIQRFRRNKVCILSMLLFAFSLVVLAYCNHELLPSLDGEETFLFLLVSRLFSGAFFGLAFLILNGTLIVDCCESSDRTRANVVSLWFYRFALVVGPLVGYLMYQEVGFLNSVYFSVILGVVSVGVLSSVQFPFKAPDESIHVFSLDRYFSPRSYPLVIVTVAAASILGLALASCFELHRYILLSSGFVFALICRLAMSEWFKGRVSVYVSLSFLFVGVLFSFSENFSVAYFQLIVLGCGLALLLSSLQVLFINVGDHCQRGTSQSTYILSTELGVALGYAWALMAYGDNVENLQFPAIICFAVVFLSCIFIYKVWLKSNIRKS